MFKKLLIILTFILAIPACSFASSNYNVSGFAWSYNTGWIKMNSCIGNNCDSVTYGVNITINGDFEGYGWSSNVGWIAFDGGTCGGPTHATFAQDGSATLSGWAQAVAATDSGSNSGGWNGCIKMSGQTATGGNFGVTIGPSGASQQFSGYGWNANSATTPTGLDPAVGESWVDFSGVEYTPEASSIDLSVDHWNTACTPTNNKINLTWATAGVTSGSCTWSGELSGSAANSGNNQLFNLGNAQQSYTINLSCLPTGTTPGHVTVSCAACSDGSDNDSDNTTDANDISCKHPCTQNYQPEQDDEGVSYSAQWIVQNCPNCTINTTPAQNLACYCSFPSHANNPLCGTPPPGPLTAPKYEER